MGPAGYLSLSEVVWGERERRTSEFGRFPLLFLPSPSGGEQAVFCTAVAKV